MAWQTIRSGFTGPSNKIGGSSEYHIDWKIADTLPIEKKVAAFDQVAKDYAKQNRVLEFSNPAVANLRYDLNAPFEKKADLLNRAAAAHSHSVTPGWKSIDAYPVLKTAQNRFTPGSVEDAPILLPVLPGSKITRGTSPGYGYFSTVLDDKGNPIFKVGHGNIDKPEKGPSEFVVGGEVKPSQSTTTANTTKLPSEIKISINVPEQEEKEEEEEEKKDPITELMDNLIAQAFQKITGAGTENPWA